jgi:hypothetical protein
MTSKIMSSQGIAENRIDTGFPPSSGHDRSRLAQQSVGDELDERFWASVDYCGYLRHSHGPESRWHPSTDSQQSDIFLNGAFARLAGTDSEELVAR